MLIGSTFMDRMKFPLYIFDLSLTECGVVNGT